MQNFPNLSEHPISRAAGVVGLATLLSRVLGYVRDMAIAWAFGAGFSTDAFLAAFKIPNFFRRLFAEGSLSLFFIPVFTQSWANKGRTETVSLAHSAIYCGGLVLAVGVILAIIGAPLLMRAIAYGFVDEALKFSFTVSLSRIMLPYVFFIGLSALCMGILNSLGHFAAPALSPAVLNMVLIFSIFCLAPLLPRNVDPIVGLSVGVLIGGGIQLIMQVWVLARKGISIWPKTITRHPALKTLGLNLLPTLIGASAYQINTLIITAFASLQAEGALTFLYFADRLVQLPLGLFGFAAATAVMPNLARQGAISDLDRMGETVAQTLRLVLFVILPAMVGLMILRQPIISLLFQRGAFDAQSVRLTATALLYYASGLWAFATVRILVQVFYAVGNTRLPVFVALVAVFTNLTLAWPLGNWMGIGGLSLSIAIAAMLHFILLAVALNQQGLTMAWRPLIRAIGIFGMNTCVMGAAVWMGSQWLIPIDPGDVVGLMIQTGGSIGIGVLVYGLLSRLTNRPELILIMRSIHKGE